MKIIYLFLGVGLALIPEMTFAQCVATQDCSTLGYTESSCSGGNGVKCPFGNKWACFKSENEIRQQLCSELGFKYSCSGAGYVGGEGSTCEGKYAVCKCISRYKWKEGECKEWCPYVTKCGFRNGVKCCSFCNFETYQGELSCVCVETCGSQCETAYSE